MLAQRSTGWVRKISQLAFCQNFVISLPSYMRCTHFPRHLIYVNALLCKMQMLQIVALRGDYQYQNAHLFKIII